MLKKLCLILFWVLLGAMPGQAQLVKEYKVSERKGFDLVKLHFSTYKSLTQLKRVQSLDPIYIHGHLQKSNILPDFSYSLFDNVLNTYLIHKNIESDNLGKASPPNYLIPTRDLNIAGIWDWLQAICTI